MKVKIKKHPELDFFLLIIGGAAIPTKQDKFQSLVGYKIFVEEEGKRMPLDEYDVYIKRKGKDNLKAFEEEFKRAINDSITDEHPYKRDIKLEVIISVSMDKKRLKDVDVDNLAKAILDCFCGLVFEDDSQVINLLVKKYVHPIAPKNSLMVGIRIVKDERDSWFNNIKLAYPEFIND